MKQQNHNYDAGSGDMLIIFLFLFLISELCVSANNKYQSNTSVPEVLLFLLWMCLHKITQMACYLWILVTYRCKMLLASSRVSCLMTQIKGSST